MKKYFPFISFILILSFVLPFFPCFFVLTQAEDSVSSDDAYIKWEKDNVDAIRNGLAQNGLVVNNDYYSDDYYYVDPDDNLWRDILVQWGLDGTDYGKPLSRVAYDYAVSNNITNTDIYNNCFNNIYNHINSLKSYYVNTTIHSDDLLEMFRPVSPSSFLYDKFTNLQTQLKSIVNNSGLCFFYNNGQALGNTNSGIRLYSVSYNFIEDNFVFLSTYPSDNSILNNSLFFVNLGSVSNAPGFTPGIYGFINSEGLTQTFNCVNYNWSNYSGSVFVGSNSSFSLLDGVGLYYYLIGNYMRSLGGVFIVPDSVSNFSFPVFKDSNSALSFKYGDSFVYEFDPDFNINSYGTDLDLSKLYDVIRDTVSDSEGDIIASINRVANDYLADQVELLGDIKNALNDSFGRSWLRKIHDQLSDYFPQTIDSLADLKDAISDLSFSGGSGAVADLTNIEDDLSTIKGLLILQTAHDIIDDLKNNNVQSNDFNDVVTVANTKFPFSIPNDIVTILTLFVAEPEEPEFSFPVPFADNNETFDIDISFIGSSLPYIRGAFIILFILFLVVVSVKVINSLKE